MMRKISEKQLVREVGKLGELAKEFRIPTKGWTRLIRELLNMPTKVLASRCGLDRSTVTRLEQSEQKRTITLNSLERLADGLNCDVKYVFVPREPLDSYLMRKARDAAKKEISKVAQTMRLEDQGLSREQLEIQIQDLAEELLHKKSSLIWEDDK